MQKEVDQMQKEILLYDELRKECKQAFCEMGVAYQYFEGQSDYNGMCILYQEICDFEEFFRELDAHEPRTSGEIHIPNIYEWGFYNMVTYNEAKQKADSSVVYAISQKREKVNTPLFVMNGDFYGYYCYNIYSKCLGWINFTYRKYSINTQFFDMIINFFESAMNYFMRYKRK